VAHQVAARQRRLDQPDRSHVLEHAGRVEVPVARDRRVGDGPGDQRHDQPGCCCSDQLVPSHRIPSPWSPKSHRVSRPGRA
jgi:hypothetical protein